MNKLGCLIVMLITCRVCGGQNLVPNSDFEQYSGCPNAVAQLDSALFWFNPTIATPDYFNACANPSMVGVPVNIGTQNAFSGDGYCGIHLWHQNISNYREYIEVPLTSSLIASQCYHFEMYINLSEFSSYSAYAVGAYFSDTSFTNFSTFIVLPFAAQIQNTAINVPDFTNWTLVSGNYTAHGGESYLIVGNFKDDANTTTTLTPNVGDDVVYIYIDSVSLVACLPTDLSGYTVDSDISVYPNPMMQELNIASLNHEPSEIILYDMTSRVLLQQTFTASTILNTQKLSKGIYIYEVRNKKGVIKKGKVVKG